MPTALNPMIDFIARTVRTVGIWFIMLFIFFWKVSKFNFSSMTRMPTVANLHNRAFSAGSGNGATYAMSSPSATTGGGLGGNSPVCSIFLNCSALHAFPLRLRLGPLLQSIIGCSARQVSL